MGIREKIFAWANAKAANRINCIYDDYKTKIFSGLSGTILEIGPGPGTNLPYFTSKIKYIAVEPNIYMHSHLKEKAKKFGIKINIIKGNSENLPLKDKSVDVVISTLVLCSVSDLKKSLKEIERVLKPKGKLIFIEHVASTKPSLRKIQNFFNPAWRWLALGCNLNRETWLELKKAGFKLEYSYLDMNVGFPLVKPHIIGIATL